MNSNSQARKAMSVAADRLVEAYSLYEKMMKLIGESQSAVENANSVSINRDCPQYQMIEESFMRAFTDKSVNARMVQASFQTEILKKLRDSVDDEDFPYDSSDPCIRQADHDGSWNLLAHIENGWFETCYRHDSLQELLKAHKVTITGHYIDKTGAFFTVKLEDDGANLDDIYANIN